MGEKGKAVWFWGLLFLLLSLGPFSISAAADKAEIKWRQLLPGMEFGFLDAEATVRTGSSRVAVLRVDPRRFRFRVLAARPGSRGHDAGQWRQKTGALAVVNAGQYDADHNYLGLLVYNGKVQGRLASRQDGLFVSDPDDPFLPPARVIDLRYTAFDLLRSPYRQAAQSLMLLDRFGQIRVRRSPRIANRTALAQDVSGRILIMTTEGGHTLWELAGYLKKAGLKLREVMCMDGGREAQLDLEAGGFSYKQYGEPPSPADLPLPWPSPSLPAALGVFPR
ncbi:MAG: phosphodiester glycosidase family protein [Desulfarculaceae bacterium]|jgi:uncharacterized protein YigE (DUF2233 family)